MIIFIITRLCVSNYNDYYDSDRSVCVFKNNSQAIRVGKVSSLPQWGKSFDKERKFPSQARI